MAFIAEELPQERVGRVAIDEAPMQGLRPLVHLFRYPETLFGAASERRADLGGQPMDWGALPDEVRRCFQYWGTRCTDVLLHLQLAAEVLRRHGVTICRGEIRLTCLRHEDLSPSVFIELSIDATPMQAVALTRELDRRAIDLGVPYEGFVFCFMEGEDGDDEDDEEDGEDSCPTCGSLRDSTTDGVDG